MESPSQYLLILFPTKGVDFPSCEKVVKIIVEDMDTLGYHSVVFRSDNEPSILALLRAVKLFWTGDVVQETSAEGDPQSNGAAECSENVVKGHVRLIKGSGVGFECRSTRRPRSIDVACAVCSQKARCSPWHSSVSEYGGCLCSHPTVC